MHYKVNMKEHYAKKLHAMMKKPNFYVKLESLTKFRRN